MLQYIAIMCVAVNLILLFWGILGDPGISKATYLHYTKNWYSDGKDLYTQDSDDDSIEMAQVSEDIEASPSDGLQKRRHFRKESLKAAQAAKYYQPQYEQREHKGGQQKKVLYCVKCNVDVTEDMEHCDDCQVCVSDYDHHCVFFSKCIGGGNIYCFAGSIGMLVFNFIIIFVILIVDIDGDNGRKS